MSHPNLIHIEAIRSLGNRPLSDTAMTLSGKPQKGSINFIKKKDSFFSSID
jgi:hypothetical protein